MWVKCDEGVPELVKLWYHSEAEQKEQTLKWDVDWTTGCDTYQRKHRYDENKYWILCKWKKRSCWTIELWSRDVPLGKRIDIQYEKQYLTYPNNTSKWCKYTGGLNSRGAHKPKVKVINFPKHSTPPTKEHQLSRKSYLEKQVSQLATKENQVSQLLTDKYNLQEKVRQLSIKKSNLQEKVRQLENSAIQKGSAMKYKTDLAAAQSPPLWHACRVPSHCWRLQFRKHGVKSCVHYSLTNLYDGSPWANGKILVINYDSQNRNCIEVAFPEGYSMSLYNMTTRITFPFDNRNFIAFDIRQSNVYFIGCKIQLQLYKDKSKKLKFTFEVHLKNFTPESREKIPQDVLAQPTNVRRRLAGICDKRTWRSRGVVRLPQDRHDLTARRLTQAMPELFDDSL